VSRHPFVTIETVTKTQIDLDMETAAQWFAHLTDEQQADFFVAVAKISSTWPYGGGSQWWYVGRHLRDCSCSTDEARELVREIGRGIAA
jgi:hypothetical protein